jgi:hypothetical protein
MPEFQLHYGPDEQCEAALGKHADPISFCGGHEHGLVYGRRFKRYPFLLLRPSANAHGRHDHLGYLIAYDHLVSFYMIY